MDRIQREAASWYKEYLRQIYRGKVRAWRRKPEATRGPRPKLKDMILTLENNPQPASEPSSRATRASITGTSLIGFAPGLALAVLKRKIESDQFRSAEANRFFQGSTTTTQRRAVMNTPFWEGAGSSFRKRDDKTGQMVLHPKIRFICEKTDEMLRDTEPHKQGDTSYGVFPKKMVICVPHAWHGFILTTFLFKTYPTRNFTFLGSGSTPAERRSLTAPFQRNPIVRAAEDSRSDDPIALISTFDLMGEGLNLIRCNYAIAASPLATASRHDQFFGRINRQGQFCTTHSYVLYDNGNPVDVTTYYRMRTRTALTMREEDMPSGLNFLLEDIQEIEEEVEGTVGSEAEDPEAGQVEQD